MLNWHSNDKSALNPAHELANYTLYNYHVYAVKVNKRPLLDTMDRSKSHRASLICSIWTDANNPFNPFSHEIQILFLRDKELRKVKLNSVELTLLIRYNS